MKETNIDITKIENGYIAHLRCSEKKIYCEDLEEVGEVLKDTFETRE